MMTGTHIQARGACVQIPHYVQGVTASRRPRCGNLAHFFCSAREPDNESTAQEGSSRSGRMQHVAQLQWRYLQTRFSSTESASASSRSLHSLSRICSSCSQSRASPNIPINLEQITLLVWKTDFAFLVEPRLLKIVCQPVDVRMILLIHFCTHFSLSTRGSSITLSVRLSASQQ